MSDTVLQLGDFSFGAYEVPEKIPFGGGQRLVAHKLPGGARVVQAMGRDDAPLAWSGLFLGAGATERARYVDSLRIAGQPLKLTWAEFKYTVVIESFTCDYENFHKMPYQISCMVVSDDAAPSTSYVTLSYDAAIMGDDATAQALGGSIGDGTLSGLLSTMDGALRSVSGFAQQAQGTINCILGPVAAVQQRVQMLIASTGNTMANVSTLGGLLPNSPISQLGARVSSQLAVATQLPLLYQLSSVAGRITTNLNLVNASPNTRTIQAGGGTLFDIAAAEFGDPTRWNVIAKANGMTDPNITTVGPLLIPKYAPDSGGVPT